MSYHRITVVGHVGSDADHQVTPTGKDVTNFPLYVNERYGESERAIRYKVKLWGELGLSLVEYLRKGQMLVIDGTPSLDVWQGADGEPRAQMVVTAQVIRFLGPSC